MGQGLEVGVRGFLEHFPQQDVGLVDLFVLAQALRLGDERLEIDGVGLGKLFNQGLEPGLGQLQFAGLHAELRRQVGVLLDIVRHLRLAQLGVGLLGVVDFALGNLQPGQPLQGAAKFASFRGSPS